MSAILESALDPVRKAQADAADAQREVQPEVRLQQIKLRRAEIAAALTASKHQYVLTGEGRPFVERTGLEAEDAALTLEALRISGDAQKAKVFRRMQQNADLLGQLLRLLDERGLWLLAVEASERSAVELSNITPWKTAARQEGGAA